MTKRKQTITKIIIVTTIILTILSMSFVEYNGIEAESGVFLSSIFRGLIHPNMTALTDFTKTGVLYLILETLAIAFLGTFIGVILSVPLAFLAAQNMVPKWVTVVTSFMITLTRVIPPLVVGIIVIRATGAGAFAGVLTLALTSLGMISKLYIEAIEDLDQGIIEALDASGCTWFQKIRYGILPQLMGSFISIGIYRLEINVKNASILGLVGAGGIGAPLTFAMGGYRWADVGALLWGLIVLVLCVEFVSNTLRKKIA